MELQHRLVEGVELVGIGFEQQLHLLGLGDGPLPVVERLGGLQADACHQLALQEGPRQLLGLGLSGFRGDGQHNRDQVGWIGGGCGDGVQAGGAFQGWRLPLGRAVGWARLGVVLAEFWTNQAWACSSRASSSRSIPPVGGLGR